MPQPCRSSTAAEPTVRITKQERRWKAIRVAALGKNRCGRKTGEKAPRTVETAEKQQNPTGKGPRGGDSLGKGYGGPR